MNLHKSVGVLMALFLVGCGESSAPPAPTGNFNLTVIATGVNSDSGQVRAVLCAQGENFPNDCEIKQVAPAASGNVMFMFKAVPAGTYAFAAFHDENDDQKINFADGRTPSEGLMFSNNAMGRMGPPQFKQSAFELVKDTKMMVQARYFGSDG